MTQENSQLNINKKEPLCWVPYYSIEIGTNGELHPCCKIKGTGPYTSESKIDDFYSEAANEWRRQNFEEQDVLPEACVACKVPANTFSYRGLNKTIWLEKFKWAIPEAPTLKKIIIAMDNVCSSSCVMCGPAASSTIANFLNKNVITFFDSRPEHKMSNLIKKPVHQGTTLELLDHHKTTLEVLHIYGGEPLISPNLEKAVEVAINAPNFKFMSFSTGLQNIKESHVELLSKYRSQLRIKANISLDGPLDLNHWSRGISADEFTKNFKLVKDNMQIIGFQSTIGIYNVFALPELVEVVKRLWTGMPTQVPILMSGPIQSPIELSPNQLPDDVKEQVIHKLTMYLESGKCPSYATELIQTGIDYCSRPSTLPWETCREYVHIFPILRGNNLTIEHWIEKYLSADVVDVL